MAAKVLQSIDAGDAAETERAGVDLARRVLTSPASRLATAYLAGGPGALAALTELATLIVDGAPVDLAETGRGRR